MNKYLLPFIAFIFLAAFLARGLYLDPREIPSPLVGKKIPAANLPLLDRGEAKFNVSELTGQPFLLNVFASWCAPCLVEHPLISNLAAMKVIDIYWHSYKYDSSNTIAWLEKNGNPYLSVGVDAEGYYAIDLGVYGVPETFLIDSNGVILFKQVGPLTQEVIIDEILGRIEDLKSE